MCLVCSSQAWRRDIVANRKRLDIFVWHKTELECGVGGVAVMMTCLMVWSIGTKTPPKMTDVEAALLWVSLPQVLLRRWRMVQKARLNNTFFFFFFLVFSAPSEKHTVVPLCYNSHYGARLSSDINEDYLNGGLCVSRYFSFICALRRIQ